MAFCSWFNGIVKPLVGCFVGIVGEKRAMSLHAIALGSVSVSHGFVSSPWAVTAAGLAVWQATAINRVGEQ